MPPMPVSKDVARANNQTFLPAKANHTYMRLVSAWPMPNTSIDLNVPQRMYTQPPNVTPIMVDTVMFTLPAMLSSSRENPTPLIMKALYRLNANASPTL